MTPIIVTGAGGYLGRAVCRHLTAARLPWIGLGRAPGPDVTACDMSDAESVREWINPGATVIHSAAIVPNTALGYTDESAARKSLSMVDALIAARPGYIVFPSSMTVYAANAVMPVDEKDISASVTGYAAGKITAERRFAASGIATTILRLPGLFGPPRRGGLLYNVAVAFARGQNPELPSHPPLWAPLHIEDAAAYCLRAVLKPADGVRILNVGYPDTFTIGGAVGQLADILGRTVRGQEPGPPFAMRLDRLRAELGIEPITWDRRLREFIGWATGRAIPC